MNRLYILLLVIFLQLSVKAQDVWNFTIFSVDSVEYTLYDYLDMGQPVVVDMFARYCSSCSDAMPVMDSIWLENGSGISAQVWAMEVSGYHDSIVAQYKEDHAVSFPFFSSQTNPAFLDSFPLNYTPWYIVFCPDYSYRQVEQENLRHFINACSTLNIEASEEKQSLQVYKTQSGLKIFSSQSLDWHVEIVNIAGQPIYISKLEGEIGFIEIPLEIETGIFLISFIDKKGERFVSKFISF